MKKLLISTTLIFLSITISAKDKINITAGQTEERILDNFSGIELKCFAKVYLNQGKEQTVTIDAMDPILRHITTKVINGSLIINYDKELSGIESAIINITVNDLEKIELTGSGNITMQNQFKSDHMEFLISGSGNINSSVDLKSLRMSVSGSGNMELKGRSAEADIKISGSGNINGKELKTFTSSINITGSGTSTVNVNNELTVSITGSGNVFYVSDPERIHSKINGTGKIEKVVS